MNINELDKFGPRGTYEGSELKCQCGWGWISTGHNGIDTYDFSALPNFDSEGLGYGTQNTWWTGTEDVGFMAFSRLIGSPQITRESLPKDIKNSVRCIKD